MRALVSPDFSSINFAATNSVGTNYSLLFEYPLTKRLFISSGAILSTKVYSSYNEIVYGKYTADGVEGTCQILDIPINVYYLFNTPGKFSFFAGAGASSYFMMSEEYTFYINTNSGKREFDWSFKGENIDWFKMLNVSAGVQYKVSNKFYLQAEPFVKVPMAGIGEWDIDLSSVGVFMGLKYRLNK
jgi:opacity protein-like surface antigen